MVAFSDDSPTDSQGIFQHSSGLFKPILIAVRYAEGIQVVNRLRMFLTKHAAADFDRFQYSLLTPPRTAIVDVTHAEHTDGMLTNSMRYLKMPVVGRLLASAWKREDIYKLPDKLDEAYQLGQTIAAGE